MKNIILLFTVFIVFCISFLANTPSRLAFTEDIALTYAVVREIASGNLVLLGPPSHVGGRHLGPLYYYIISLTYVFTGFSIYYSMLITVALHLTGIIFIAKTLKLFFKESNILYFLLPSLLLINPSYLEIIRNPWHGNTIFLASSFYIYYFFKWFLSGQISCLKLILISSILVQIHFSAAFLVVGSIVFLVIYRKSYSLTWSDKNVFLVYSSLFILWIPSIIFQVFYENNLSNLFSGLLSRENKTSFGIINTYYFFKEFYWKFFLVSKKLGVIYFNAFLLVLSVLFFIQYKKSNKFFNFFIISNLLYFVVVSNMAQPIKIYFIYALLPLPILFFSYLLMDLKNVWQGRLQKVLATSMILISSFFEFVCIIDTSSYLKRNATPVGHSLSDTSKLANILEKASEDQNFALYVDSATRFSRDGILFFLGRKYFSNMNYSDTFLDLKNINLSPKNSFLVACPKIISKSVKKWDDFFKLKSLIKRENVKQNEFVNCTILKYSSYDKNLEG